jgi:hypothetical protein
MMRAAEGREVSDRAAEDAGRLPVRPLRRGEIRIDEILAGDAVNVQEDEHLGRGGNRIGGSLVSRRAQRQVGPGGYVDDAHAGQVWDFPVSHRHADVVIGGSRLRPGRVVLAP